MNVIFFFFFLPLTPVFHTVLVYLRPETMFLETVNVNLMRIWHPSLSVKRLLLGLFVSGIGRTRSVRPRHMIVRLKTFTSGSLLSDI